MLEEEIREAGEKEKERISKCWKEVDEMQILEPSAGYGWYMQIVEGQKRKLKVEDSYSNCRFFYML